MGNPSGSEALTLPTLAGLLAQSWRWPVFRARAVARSKEKVRMIQDK